jgi:hypothetical protein
MRSRLRAALAILGATPSLGAMDRTLVILELKRQLTPSELARLQAIVERSLRDLVRGERKALSANVT